MKKVVGIAFILVLVMASFGTAYGQGGDPASNGAAWLVSQQEGNGSFGDEIGATALAVFAAQSVGEENEAALAYIEAQSFDDVGLDEVGLTLIALTAIETDPSEFADGVVLARLSALLRDADAQRTDALCLGLIARINLDIPISDDLMNLLLSRQEDNGGFAVDDESSTDVTSTSLCIHVLSANDQPDALADALNYLRATQFDDSGWAIFEDSTASDPLGTAFGLQALSVANESTSDWGSPERLLITFMDDEGAFIFEDGSDAFFNAISTIVAVPVFRGVHLNSYAPAYRMDDGDDDLGAPVLDANWGLVGDGFLIELDTADDFFTTVTDPFTGESLYGVEIINWTTEYSYTGYIVQEYLTADILLWMIEQDPTVIDSISDETLSLMNPAERERLPEALQASNE